MIYLLLSVVASTLVFVIFKLFGTYKVNNLKAIIINYFTAHLIGSIIAGGYSPSTVLHENWLPVAFGLGILFITLFNVMALTSQKNGVSVASVANKMSVVIPVAVAIIFFGEALNIGKGVGIGLACVGVWLTSVKNSEGRVSSNILLPVVLFLGSGLLDTILNYASKVLLQGNEDIFSAVIFLFAGLFGLSFLIYKRDFKFTLKDVYWGVILGSINYFSIYLLLKALAHAPWESSSVFPINNMSIVGVSTLVSWIFFKEHMSWKNWLGISISILSIVIITWA